MMSTNTLMSTGPGSDSTTTGVAVGRVVVVARLQLIAQAVGAALREHGVRAEPILWEQTTRRAGRELGTVTSWSCSTTSPRRRTSWRPAIWCPARRRAASTLTRRQAGPAWGALLAAGAAAVLMADGSLDHMNAVVSRVAEGEPVMDEDRRAAGERVGREASGDRAAECPCGPALPARAAGPRPALRGDAGWSTSSPSSASPRRPCAARSSRCAASSGSTPSWAPSRCSTGSASPRPCPSPASRSGRLLTSRDPQTRSGIASHSPSRPLLRNGYLRRRCGRDSDPPGDNRPGR